MWRLPSKLIKALRLDSGSRKRLFVATGSVTMIALMLKGLGYSRTIERLSRRRGEIERAVGEALP